MVDIEQNTLTIKTKLIYDLLHFGMQNRNLRIVFYSRRFNSLYGTVYDCKTIRTSFEVI